MMNATNLLKLLALPKSSTRVEEDRLVYSSVGGYAGQKVVEKAERAAIAAGWTKLEGRRAYLSPSGLNVLTVEEYFASHKSYNSFTATVSVEV